MSTLLTLSREEASAFLRDVLQLAESGRGNRLEFLNQIIGSFKTCVPCHNVSLLASGERRVPDWDRVKADILAGRGELGCALNVFLSELMKAFDYKATLNTAVMYALEAFHSSHVIVLVSDLVSAGDSYLVDVGNEYPTIEAIPLGFGEESPPYHHSFLQYKFMCREGRILRLHNRGQHDSKAQIDASLDGFYVYYDFDLLPKSPQMLDECFNLIYTDPKASPFHKSLRASIFRGGKCCLMKDSELLVENENHKLISTPVSSTSDIQKAFVEYFPMINADLVSTALGKFRDG